MTIQSIASVQPRMAPAIAASAGTNTAFQSGTVAVADRRHRGRDAGAQAVAPSRDRALSPARLMTILLAVLALGAAVALTVYGFDYYRLGLIGRALSTKHSLLRSSGPVGMGMALAGMLLFLCLFAYPVRKRWPWLARRGNTRNWLTAHVLFGFAAPVFVAFHAAFQFRGIAGMAFWIMFAVAVSGVAGRYLYAQIPRTLSAAELSLQEARELQEQLTAQLAGQTLLTQAELEPLFHMPSPEQIARTWLPIALCSMIAVDMARPLHLARLRQRLLNFRNNVATVGGLLPSHNAQLEAVVNLARRQASLSKRILFLSRSQQMFHLWHVIHRPFSYSLVVLACLHIVVVALFGVVMRFF